MEKGIKQAHAKSDLFRVGRINSTLESAMITNRAAGRTNVFSGKEVLYVPESISGQADEL